MNTRIRELRKSLNLTLAEFGEKISVSHTTICDIENGKTNINDRIVKLICSEFNVNEEWLRTGKGDIYNSNNDYLKFLNAYNNLSKSLQDFLIECAKNLLDAQNKL